MILEALGLTQVPFGDDFFFLGFILANPGIGAAIWKIWKDFSDAPKRIFFGRI